VPYVRKRYKARLKPRPGKLSSLVSMFFSAFPL
jgi:hypothetical protein